MFCLFHLFVLVMLYFVCKHEITGRDGPRPRPAGRWSPWLPTLGSAVLALGVWQWGRQDIALGYRAPCSGGTAQGPSSDRVAGSAGGAARANNGTKHVTFSAIKSN